MSLRLGVVLALAGAASLSAQDIAFTDDFSPPSPMWSNTSGNWTASNGVYYAQTPNNSPATMTLLPFDLTSYTLTVKLNPLGDSGIYVRSNAAGTRYLLLVIGGSGYGQGTRGGYAGNSIYWLDSSAPSLPANFQAGVVDVGMIINVTVQAVGNTFTVYLNNSSTPVSSYTDNNVGSDGLVGLYDNQPNITSGHGSGAPSAFSNFNLTGNVVPVPQTYYYSQLAFGGGYQTTMTYINYSAETVTCTTNFYSDYGNALGVPLSVGPRLSRTDVLPPGGSVHDQTVADLSAPGQQGWAQASCDGTILTSFLYRYYQAGVPAGEASVIPETTPTTKFVTFAQTATGVAYANPSSTQPATVTFTVLSTAGVQLATGTVTLAPMAHGSASLGTLVNLPSFTGILEITSTSPIISLSLNAEAFPSFSSLPAGDLPTFTGLP